MKPIYSSIEQGYVLLMTLILLIIITVLALAQVSLNISQIHIAANATDTEISFEKTEGALNAAANNLFNGTYNPASFVQNTQGLYVMNPNAQPLWTTVNWSNSSQVINSFQGNSSVKASYIIERLPSVIKPGQNMQRPAYIYRITARSVGDSGNSAVILQSTIQMQP